MNIVNKKLILSIVLIIVLIIGVVIKIVLDARHKNMENRHIEQFNLNIELSRSAWQRGDFENTVILAETALSIANTDDEKSVSHYWKGVGLYKLGRLEEAEKEEELAI